MNSTVPSTFTYGFLLFVDIPNSYHTTILSIIPEISSTRYKGQYEVFILAAKQI